MMNTLTLLVKRQPVALFGALTVLLSFAVYLLPLPRAVRPFLMVLLPAIIALGLSALTEGKAGVHALLGKLGQSRIRGKWLAIAVLMAWGLRLSMSVIALLLGLIPAL